MIVHPGLRIGWWKPGKYHREPFLCLGHYTGENIGDHVVGTLITQKLMDGELTFRTGVLFRPDLGRKDRLETILILDNYVEEMWEYDSWERAS